MIDFDVTDRQLVRFVTIDGIEPIEGADRIEVARVGGWRVVVQKGLYVPGDEAFYCEIDSCLPVSLPEFANLAERGTFEYGDEHYHRLKTIRLRGVYSQGLLVPFEELAHEWDVFELARHGRFAHWLGVGKYDPPLPVSTGGKIVGKFPGFIRKTDSERVQNLSDVWGKIGRHRWLGTEKIDGTSCTIWRDEYGLHAASRNWEIAEGDSIYWRIPKEFGLFDVLTEVGDWMQMEIAGPGIQGNRLQLPKVRPFIFDASSDRVYSIAHMGGLGVPILAPMAAFGATTIDDVVAQVDGMKSVINPKVQAEGVVFHATRKLKELDGRSTFKAINNKYLLKNGE